ncbi:MAG: mtaB [Phycisphaerales bacterium]|nr:mtaB [Phycisphaerales bacterium]
MKTFNVQTLGCKVNHYESEQISALLRSRGLTPTDASQADLRIIHTCSVTTQAASQSRQTVRRMVRLPVLAEPGTPSKSTRASCDSHGDVHPCGGIPKNPEPREVDSLFNTHPSPRAKPEIQDADQAAARPRVIVTGCWATSDQQAASALPGVDAVVGHHQDVRRELDRLLTLWQGEPRSIPLHYPDNPENHVRPHEQAPEPMGKDKGWMIEAGTPVGLITNSIEPKASVTVNQNLAGNRQTNVRDGGRGLVELFVKGVAAAGTTALPLLGQRQSGRQRAFLKIQDGCDAHCTYCIIPSLRPNLWSKPVADAVQEANALVAAGHVEIVLTGIFLGAYGQPTALRRRQPQGTDKPLAALIDALCTRVPGLRRLRLSSLEPGDLTDELLSVLGSHAQVVPHFHLPLQSGSEALLRKMNRQYTRDDFLRMVDRVRNAFDRPALTTDVVAGFPGETDEEFTRTMEVVEAGGFIHVHAFPYSPRPGTAAARWTKQFVRGPVVNERIERLRTAAVEHSFAFRSTFLGETVEVIVERDAADVDDGLNVEDNSSGRAIRHGRCERYFPVHFDAPLAKPGDSVRLKITGITPEQTMGQPTTDN